MISTNGRQSFISFLYNDRVTVNILGLVIVSRGTSDYVLFLDVPEVGEHVYRIDGFNTGEAWLANKRK